MSTPEPAWVAILGATYRVHFRRVIELQPGHHTACFQHGPRPLDVLHPATFLHVQGHDHLHYLFLQKEEIKTEPTCTGLCV